MSSASIGELQEKLKEAEGKIALLEQIFKLEARVREGEEKVLTEKISQLELKLKESLQANVDCTAKLSGLQGRLHRAKQEKGQYKSSFNGMKAKFRVANQELENAKAKISSYVISDGANGEMMKALHMIYGKHSKIRIRYDGTLDIDGWHSSTEHKFKYGKTYSDFKSFWNARTSQKTFDNLLKLYDSGGRPGYFIHVGNEEISELKEEHRFMATRVENMYLKIVLWNVGKGNLVAVPWNYSTNKKATRAQILDFILDEVKSRLG